MIQCNQNKAFHTIEQLIKPTLNFSLRAALSWVYIKVKFGFKELKRPLKLTKPKFKTRLIRVQEHLNFVFLLVNHMKLLSLTKEKRSKYKATQREEEARKTYKDYDWEGMFHERSLSQLKVVELNKYIAHHNLGKYGTKKAKLEAIKENIIQELVKRIEREEDGKSNNQSSSDSIRRESEDNSEEEDCVLAEIGISSSEKEEELTEEEEMIESTKNFNVNTTIVYTRSGRRATEIQI